MEHDGIMNHKNATLRFIIKLSNAAGMLFYLLTPFRFSYSVYILLQVFDSICTTSIHWWCRSNRKSTPSEQSDDTVVYTRDALWHLFNEIRDFDGYNVLQYASKLGATGKSILRSWLCGMENQSKIVLISIFC